MTLTPTQAADLAQRRRNLAWNEAKLSTAIAAKDAHGITLYTAQVATEKAAVRSLEALDAAPDPDPVPDPRIVAAGEGAALIATALGHQADAARSTALALEAFAGAVKVMAAGGFSGVQVQGVIDAFARNTAP